MLHRIVMVGLVVVGLVVAGLGVASATVWRPSDTAVMTTGEQSGATLLTTAPGVLSLVDQDVSITARSSDDAKVVLALGSQVDVEGWIGEDPALRVTGASDWETLTVDPAAPAPTDDPAAPDDPAATDDPTATDDAAAADDPAATDAVADPAADPTAAGDPAAADATASADAAPAAPGPDPSGSDMWVEATSGTGTATLSWDASSTDQVLLVAAVGEDAAAPQLTLSWPREVTTPLLWPGVAAGALLVVLGLIYGLVTRGRRHRRTAAAPARAGAVKTATDAPTVSAPASGTLTRRQLRELAEQQEAERAAAAAPRQKRQWPWTGAIPVVKPADPARETAGDDASEPAPEAHRPAWLPEGTASTSGSSWRAAWGVPTPEATATPEASGTGPAVPTAAQTPTTASAPTAGSAPTAAPTTPRATAPAAATSGAVTSAAATSGAAPTAPGQRPGPRSSKPADGVTPAASEPSAPARPAPVRPAAAPEAPVRPAAVPPVRPVDQSSPFQRITLRSSDESAPARRIRRDQQQASSAWSAPRSPWAQPARPAVDPAETEAAKTPTDDPTKDSD